MRKKNAKKGEGPLLGLRTARRFAKRVANYLFQQQQRPDLSRLMQLQAAGAGLPTSMAGLPPGLLGGAAAAAAAAASGGHPGGAHPGLPQGFPHGLPPTSAASLLSGLPPTSMAAAAAAAAAANHLSERRREEEAAAAKAAALGKELFHLGITTKNLISSRFLFLCRTIIRGSKRKSIHS